MTTTRYEVTEIRKITQLAYNHGQCCVDSKEYNDDESYESAAHMKGLEHVMSALELDNEKQADALVCWAHR